MSTATYFDFKVESSSAGVRARIAARAKSTFSRLRREPPPKRIDTPLNFNDTISHNNADIISNGALTAVYEAPLYNHDISPDGEIGTIRIHNKGKQIHNARKFWRSATVERPYRPISGKPIKIPQSSSLVTSRRSSVGNGRDRASRTSLTSHCLHLGNLFQNGLGSRNKANNNAIDLLAVFPSEIVDQIFANLDCKSLLACELVSRSWYYATNCPATWKQVFECEHGRWTGYPYDRDWKSMYEAKLLLDRRWRKGQVTPVYLKGHTDSVYCVQFDSQKIITGSRDRTIRVWNVTTGQCEKIIGSQQDGSRLGQPSTNGLGNTDLHRGSILCLQFDTDILVTGSSDHTCIVYNTSDYKPIMRLPGHRMGVLDICFDSRYIISCSKDTTICIWERSTGLLLHRLRGHQGPVNAVQLRGNLLVSASGDATIKLWDVESGLCKQTLYGHSRGLACVQCSEDGKTVISGGNDQSIRVWDVPSGQMRYEIRDAHKSLVRSLYLDNKNGRIISGSYDQSVRVWDLQTGRSLLNFPRWHGSWILAAKADDRRIISTSQDSQILMLDFSLKIDKLDCLS